MSKIYGKPGEEWGDRKVYSVLEQLPGKWTVYSQPTLVHGSNIRHPDYILIHREVGVIVLEVKDWVVIEEIDPKRALIQRASNGELAWESSPVRQARRAAFILKDMLEDESELCSYAGKLNFPYEFGAFLPHQPGSVISKLESRWSEGRVFGTADLNPAILHEKLLAMPFPFPSRMTEAQQRAVCACIDGRLKIKHPETGAFKGVYDQTQEQLAKEPLNQADGSKKLSQPAAQQPLDLQLPDAEARQQQLKTSMPEENLPLIDASHVRLVRGFAGTGKTDVLVLRTFYLYEQYPELDVLVTTFNKPILETRLAPELASLNDRVSVCTFDKLCAEIYQARHDTWSEPQSTTGVVNHLAERLPAAHEFGVDFLIQEFVWMKETGRVTREKYVNQVREGRGGQEGRSLGAVQKRKVFDLFEAYQNELAELPANDWVDLHNRVLSYLEEGIKPERQYDVILVDEAQHFGPNWFQILKYFLKPGGSLFIYDDPSQSVYRYFSWKQKGVPVVGRTRWLRIPYRCTRQIFTAAFALIESNSLAMRLLNEHGDSTAPDIEHESVRDGSPPEVHGFATFLEEKEFVLRKVQELVEGGIYPQEICLFHPEKHVRTAYESLLNGHCQIDEPKRRTGTEYQAVFIPKLQEFFPRDHSLNWEEDLAQKQLQFYMTMTRARDHLFLLHEQKFPKELEAIRKEVKWISHGS